MFLILGKVFLEGGCPIYVSSLDSTATLMAHSTVLSDCILRRKQELSPACDFAAFKMANLGYAARCNARGGITASCYNS
jgi:hypothetical protein